MLSLSLAPILKYILHLITHKNTMIIVIIYILFSKGVYYASKETVNVVILLNIC